MRSHVPHERICAVAVSLIMRSLLRRDDK